MLSNKPQPIELKELISRIKQELLEDHDTSQPLFAIGKVDLEVSFTVERSMNGGVDFHVVQTGVDKTMQQVQKITVALEPLLTPEEIRKTLTDEQKRKAQQQLTREYPSGTTRG